MISRNIEIYPDVSAIGDRLAELLQQALYHRISFVLSGGNTPKMIFSHLGRYHSSIHWQNIDFYWGDERCVSPDHPESNYLMAKQYLFDAIQPGKLNIHRIRGEDPPESEMLRYQKEIISHVALDQGKPVFDLVMLGLGEDGHTASIFPDQMILFQSDDICALAIHPKTGQKRITLTGPVINKAKTVLFIVTGKNKSKIVSQIILRKEGSELYPANFVKPEHGRLYWLMDEDASSDL